MKNPPIFLVLLCMVFFILSCDNQNQTLPAEQTPETKEIGIDKSSIFKVLADTISIDSFHSWTHNWKQEGASWMSKDSLYGFNLPLIDLREVLGETPDSSRFYIGLESLGGKRYTAKLMVVGVKAGKDLIDYKNGQYVYDVSTACPPYCN